MANSSFIQLGDIKDTNLRRVLQEIIKLVDVAYDKRGTTPFVLTTNYIKDKNSINQRITSGFTGVGLDTSTGKYIVPSGTNYLGSSTSVMSALVTLDSKIASGFTSVGLNTVTGGYIVPSVTNYLGGSTSVMSALVTLDSKIASGFIRLAVKVSDLETSISSLDDRISALENP